ncbi:MAG: aromatic acid/H+ symport family MFS transporter [Dermatophilus congolensis]|nr:aromatic acid/H+ symport family MFS transporter [Dermatophilus congolensis]
MSTTTRTSRAAAPNTARGGNVWAAVLCWLTVALEGFDLVALGAVIPTLLETKHLGMTPADATFVATVSLIGVGIGAAAGGHITDRYGRRVALFGSVLVFSVFTILVPLAPSVMLMAAARFVAGLGLGACMPTAITIMSEIAPATRRASATTITMTGYHVGAVAMSLLAIALVPDWHILFYLGGGFGLLLLPLVWFGVPELAVTEPVTEPTDGPAATEQAASASAVLRHPYRFTTLAAWVTSFMGLLLVYGLNTWLPQIMRSAGYSLASSLSLLLIMNAGAILGLVLAGMVGDMRGIKAAATSWFVASAAFLALLSIRMESDLLLHVVVFVTGLFVFSAQGLVYALLAHLFPAHLRGTALGFASGVGRLGAVVGPAFTGVLVARGAAHPWGFYFFAAVAVLAVVALAPMPSRPFRGQSAHAE